MKRVWKRAPQALGHIYHAQGTERVQRVAGESWEGLGWEGDKAGER